MSIGELGGDREESEEREDSEARDCGVSWERLVLLWVRGSGVNMEEPLETVSGGSR